MWWDGSKWGSNPGERVRGWDSTICPYKNALFIQKKKGGFHLETLPSPGSATDGHDLSVNMISETYFKFQIITNSRI